MADAVKHTPHTPGPWSVEDPMGADIGLSIVQAGLKSYEWTFIATVHKSEPEDSEEVGRVIGPKEQQANARLISVAPELLALVVQYRDDLRFPPAPDSRERRLDAISAVLAKIGGGA